ncbi:hypothetical protein VOLCADRAFT_93194 [Volvox carteri f. nagariensis]|uniref:Uncharacterized protein n=1 Tax=Volvox carteri f. nagariensis TaxID=3068 RepID=D8U1J2_VOLCA|nr:uncharacterized protein VOLCADRAFT_93194 [Volvox carteri f. nagariensis]EFJ46350.1 hypothetical protein VOLCADRAFT_93194 [Volvox carteri f. nagariensis]|eukprot:XP_002952503.1 hypothetical protein VOLCADRAFT_93194 [Volvox carteri f. nagariensis]
MSRLGGDGGSDDDAGGDGSDGGGGKGCYWRPGIDVNDVKGPLRRTLAAAAQAAAAAAGAAAPALGFAFYNDADPEGREHWLFAHSKGVLVFGPSGGVWITHSFPSFPARPPGRHKPPPPPPAAAADGNVVVESADGGGDMRGDGGPDPPWDVVRHAQTVYGQHALCLTLPREDLLRVAESLLVAKVYVYDHVMPDRLKKKYDVIQQLIDASGFDAAEESASGAGAAATAAADVALDLYGDCPRGIAAGDAAGGGGGSDVSRRLLRSRRSLRRGRRQQPSSLTAMTSASSLLQSSPSHLPPAARNVSQRLLTTLYGSTWRHITKSPSHAVDFHEQPSQRFRGGGYICTADPRIWSAFRQLVAEVAIVRDTG